MESPINIKLQGGSPLAKKSNQKRIRDNENEEIMKDLKLLEGSKKKLRNSSLGPPPRQKNTKTDMKSKRILADNANLLDNN